MNWFLSLVAALHCRWVACFFLMLNNIVWCYKVASVRARALGLSEPGSPIFTCREQLASRDMFDRNGIGVVPSKMLSISI
jgi:hypothetical protein